MLVRRHLLALAGGGLAMSTVLGGVAAASAAPSDTGTTYHASPSGSGTDCTLASPCSIATAVSDAGVSDTVELAPGRYGSADSPLTSGLEGGPAVFEGTPGKPNPIIYAADAADDFDAAMSMQSATLRDFDLIVANGTGPTSYMGLYDFYANDVDHVAVLAGSDGTTYVANIHSKGGGLSLTDDLFSNFQSENTASDALIIVHDGDPVTLENVTADGGDSATAVVERDGGSGSLTISNSILSGPTSLAYDDTPTVVTSDFSDGSATGDGNISTSPDFVDADGTSTAPSDYKEVADSATVNAGSSASANNTTDLAGLPRTMGRATDMGAFELPVAPHVTRPKYAKTARTVTAALKLNPEGAPTKVEFYLTKGGTTKHKALTVTGDSAQDAVILLMRLQPATTYQAHVVATNAAGAVTSATVPVKTTK